MRSRAPLLWLALVSCGGAINGTLEIGPVDDGRAFQTVFIPASGSVAEGKVYLEFQTVGTTLVLEGSSASNHGCVPLPSALKLVVITGAEGLPPGARVRASAWHYEPPAVPKGSTEAPKEVPVAERCSGVVVADATYTVAELPDAGFPDDAGPSPDVGAPDGGTNSDAEITDLQPTDSSTASDAGPSDAHTLDGETTDTSSTSDGSMDLDAGSTDTSSISDGGELRD